MIHFGEFRNIDNDLITVRFDSHGDKSDIFYSNLTLEDKENFVTVDSTKYFVEIGRDITINSNGQYKLSIVRLFKGCAVSVTKTSGTLARYVITDLEMKKSTDSVRNFSNNVPVIFTPTEDGYLLINSNRDLPTTIEAVMNRQEAKQLIFSSDPVTINLNSDGIYAPLKPTSATIRIMTDVILYGLYSKYAQGVECAISNNRTKTLLFKGYVTPTIYTQGYTAPFEQLEIECVCPLSTLEYKKWDIDKGLYTWYDIIKRCLQKANYEEFYIQQGIEIKQDRFYLKNIQIDVDAFKEKDDFITCKEVLERFCTAFGYSLTEIHGTPYFVDYANIYEDRTYTVYEFSDDVEQEAEIGSIDYIGDNESYYYTNDSQNISFDEVYGKITVTAKDEEDKTNYFGIDDDDLECLHPNIPYITIEGSGDAFYTKTDETHTTIYRFYHSKKLKHLMYQSYYDGNGRTGVYQTPFEFDPNDYPTFIHTNSEANWKFWFLNNLLPNNYCAFICKYFTYKTDVDTKAPVSIKWETALIFSYGLKTITFAGGATTRRNTAYSDSLYDHYFSISLLPVLKSREKYNAIRPTSYNRYLQCEGSVYFMYGNTFYQDCDVFNNNVKEADSTYNNSKYYNNKWLYTARLNGETSTFTTSTSQYVLPSLNHEVGVFPHYNVSKMYDVSKEYMYKWHNIKSDVRDYTEGVLDAKGDLELMLNSDVVEVSIFAPTPFFVSNSLQANYALVKDLKITMTRSYSHTVYVNGKSNDKDVIYELENDEYFDNKEYKLELDIITQSADKPISKNAIIDATNGFSYLDGISYLEHQNEPLEKVALKKYFNHYSTPKLVYECTVNSDKWLVPTSIYSPSCLHKDMVLDSYEFNVIDNNKTIKLIEK